MGNEEIDSSFFCDQEYNLWLLFAHTWRAMFKARERELSGYGITPEQAELLLAVQALGGCATPAAISRSTLREPHTISGLIDRMNTKGLITKNRDEKRRNLVRVCLTPKGEEAYQNSTRRQVISEIIAELSIEERRHMCCLLEKLQEKAIETLGNKTRPPFPPVEKGSV